MIRNALIEDIPSIIDLGKTLYNNFDRTYLIEEYINNDNYIILVNKEENFLSGFLIIYKNVDCYELEMIIVSKNYRKKGIATKLMNFFIENYCKTEDVIFLEVSCENNYAINLYKKFNFEIINVRKKYYGNIDAYIMKKVIK